MTNNILSALLLSTFLLSVSAAFEWGTTSYTASPILLLNSSVDTDFVEQPFVSRYTDDSAFVIWGINSNTTSSPAVYSLSRRIIDSTSLAAKENDTKLSLNLTLLSTPILAYSANGYIGVAGTTTNTTTNTTVVVIYLFLSSISSSTGVITIQSGGIPDNDTTTGYNVSQIWFADNYVYVAYTVTQSNVDSDVYLIGYTMNGTSVFNTTLKLNNVTLSGAAHLRCGQVAGSKIISCAWRQETQKSVVYVEADISSKTVGSEVTIATDTGDYVYYPERVVASRAYYVILITQVDNGYANKLLVRYSTDSTTYSLQYVIPTDYEELSISDGNYYNDGWFIVIRDYNSNGNIYSETEEALMRYNYSSLSAQTSDNFTLNETTLTWAEELVLLENGIVAQGLTLPNQSYYAFILDGMNGDWQSAYLAQVFKELSTTKFAEILKRCVLLSVTFVLFIVYF